MMVTSRVPTLRHLPGARHHGVVVVIGGGLAGLTAGVGPHALFRAGGGLDALRRLGIEPAGRAPRLRFAGVLVDDHVTSSVEYVRNRMRQRGRAARTMTGRGRRSAARLAETPAVAWLTPSRSVAA